MISTEPRFLLLAPPVPVGSALTTTALGDNYSLSSIASRASDFLPQSKQTDGIPPHFRPKLRQNFVEIQALLLSCTAALTTPRLPTWCPTCARWRHRRGRSIPASVTTQGIENWKYAPTLTVSLANCPVPLPSLFSSFVFHLSFISFNASISLSLI